jgi:pimeloyl-ACP methyl ester carboxylesterase
VLLIWGRGDAFGDAALAERARDARSNVSALLVEGGHLPWIDDPGHVGEAVRTFLDDKYRGGRNLGIAAEKTILDDPN